MVERVLLTLEITREEQKQIEAQARQHGYQSPHDYLLALVAEDAGDFDFDTKAGLLDGLRTSLRQAEQGDTRSVLELWDAVDLVR